MPTFRSARVSDAAAAALLTEYFAFRAASFPTPNDYVISVPVVDQFVAPHGDFILVIVGSEAVGCGGIRCLDQDTFEVKHLWVQPRVQRRGIGLAALVELERRAAGLGATTVVLDTNASLLAANQLYRSHGYTETDQYNDNPNATNWYSRNL